MEKILKISIPNYSQRQKTKPYIVYHISITAPVRSWTVQHRYSEFFTLNKKFLDLGLKPPLELPPKSSFFSFTAYDNPKFVETRRQGLEEYLQAILGSRDERFKKLPEWREFLEMGNSQNSLNKKSSEQWLEECRDLSLVINEIRTCIAARNKFVFRNETAAACEAIVLARKNHNILCTKYAELERELHQNNKPILSKGEFSRRQDLLENIRMEKEQLEKLLGNIKSSESYNSTASSSSSKHPSSSTPVYFNTKVGNGSTIGNSFGSSGGSSNSLNHIEENTQGLDNMQILQLQKDMLKDQDKTLEQFSSILNRQRRIGETINQELDLQNELLEDLDVNVNKVQLSLGQADKRMKKVLKKK
ncbi:Phox-like protein [Anaeromyces robustus]|uniref:Phox-like protein n=1 Tax=Anaeromyces robustus TaxID=1754192 RepID=A0A1Y1X949_9FUNG|nr:Phox-like protein [Anaeromyces robustus]|eukprot:ORX82301.1 Phox-like protein [Anaeromyces robustus]